MMTEGCCYLLCSHYFSLNFLTRNSYSLKVILVYRYLYYHQGPQPTLPWGILKSPSRLRTYLADLNNRVDPSPSYIINLLGQLRRGITYALELRGKTIYLLILECFV